MSKHIQKQFIDLVKTSETGFVLIENDKVLYINQSACNIFSCDNSQQSLLNLMSSDIIKKILNTRENKTENIEIKGKQYDVNVIFDTDELYIFIHSITDDEKVRRDTEYKSRCILAITQYQKQIIDNIATMLMGNDDNPELYKLMIKNTYRRIFKSNGALTEISKSIFSKCENKGCYNVNAVIEQVVENFKNLFPDANIEFTKCGKSLEAYCESNSLQTAIYSALSAFMYLDKKTGDFSIECATKDDKAIITVTAKDAAWGIEQLAFIKRERPERLLVDVHRYGYDMLRVESIMDWQGGGFDVRVRGNCTQVLLILNNEKTSNGELVMNSNNCEYLTCDDVEVIFSDLID